MTMLQIVLSLVVGFGLPTISAMRAFVEALASVLFKPIMEHDDEMM